MLSQQTTSDLDYDLTTSIRYDRSLQVDDARDGPLPFLLLKYHYDRLVQAADLHGWEDAKASLGYEFLKTTCEGAVLAYEESTGSNDPYKIRVLLTKKGILTATVIPTGPLPSAGDPFAAARIEPSERDQLWSVHLDTEPTPPSLFTVTKSTHRAHYDAARFRVNLVPFRLASKPEDVLLFNLDGKITETSVSNVAFRHDGKWLTPSLEVGCLSGTVRRWLLEHGMLEEGVLSTGSVKPGDWVLLFNAVAGCRLGKIVNP